MAPRRKSADELKLSGQFRADRHADRLHVPKMPGTPAKPRGLDKEAGKLWDSIVPQLVAKGYVAEIDQYLLQSMCELWGLYRVAVKVALADPTDKLARTACLAYFSAFDKAASQCGLIPSERSK